MSKSSLEGKLVHPAILGFTLLFAAFFSMGLQAEESVPAGGLMDEKALEVVKRMSDYLGGLKSFSFTAKSFYNQVRPSGIKILASAETEIVLARPNKVYAKTVRDDQTTRYIRYDGDVLTRIEVEEKTFSKLDVPDTVDAMLDYVIDKLEM